MVDRDYYQVLGVPFGASDEEIRSAYRKRISIIHPDRFDPVRQPEQWQVANEMLMELNAAYGVLHDRAARSRYDRNLTTAKGHGPGKGGDESGIKMRFRDLTPETQAKLLALQRGRSQFFKVRHGSPMLGFRFKMGTPAIAWSCLLVAGALFFEVVRLEAAAGWDSRTPDLIWLAVILGVTLTVGASYQLISWYRTPIRDYAYLTPLYYIRTRRGIVVFRWLWSNRTLLVKQIADRRGRERRSMVVLAFNGEPDRLVLNSAETAKEVAAALRVWEKLSAQASMSGTSPESIDPFPEISARLRHRPTPSDLRWDATRTSSMRNRA